MPNTGNSSSLFASTSPDPLVLMGPAAPMDGGSYGVSMSPDPTHSQASKALSMGAGLSEAHSTASVSHFGHITGDPFGCSMAAAIGGACTTSELRYTAGSTLNSITWSPPVHNTGGVVMEEITPLP